MIIHQLILIAVLFDNWNDDTIFECVENPSGLGGFSATGDLCFVDRGFRNVKPFLESVYMYCVHAIHENSEALDHTRGTLLQIRDESPTGYGSRTRHHQTVPDLKPPSGQRFASENRRPYENRV